MGLYSQTIKNIVAGISQQPSVLRHPEQLEYQLNGMSTEVGGLQKRPPSVHVRSLLASTLKAGIKPLVHLINRDETEKYTVMFNGEEIHVWDILGNKKTVNYQDASVKSYLTTATPRKKLKVVTVADYTFVVNTDKTTAITSEIVTDTWATQGALINVKSGQYGRTYTIFFNDVQVATHTTPDGSVSTHSTQIDVNVIAGKLRDALVTNGYICVLGEGWIYVTKTGLNITKVETNDGFNNASMFGILKTTQRFSSLPASAPQGFTVEIAGDPGSGADNYYVQYDTVGRIWKECARPGIKCAIDPATMPHTLTREADGSFTFKRADWDKRKTGDDDSNPIPSFVGQKINDLFFFRNRFGFIAGENVILSKSGEFFKFWMTSATDVLNTDTIDLAVSHNMVSILYHAVPFNEELLLFSANTQFLLKAEGVLSPKNARIDQVTEFGCNTFTRPVGAGRNIYFPAERAEYTSIKEYYAVQDVTNIKNAQDVTSHVPSLIRNSVYKMMNSTTESILLCLSEGKENIVYVYKYLFINEQRLQSSWSEWSLGEGAKILGGGFIESTLYFMVQRGEGLFLEKMSFTYNTKDFNDELYRVFMDRKTIVTPIMNQYDSVYHETTVNVQGAYGAVIPEGHYGIVTPDGMYMEFEAMELINGTIKVPGNVAGQKLILGEIYKFKITFSELMLKTVDERGTRSDTEGRLQLRNMWVTHVDSGYFNVLVEHFDKQTFSYAMTARIMGSGRNYLNKMPLETGSFKFPVQSLNTNCRIHIESALPTPVALIGAGWEGNYYRRSQRI